jgi:hypothetical protein
MKPVIESTLGTTISTDDTAPPVVEVRLDHPLIR